MTPPVTRIAGGQYIWTRERTEQFLRDYLALYGDEAMTAAAFSPSTAKWRDRQIDIDRYYKGNPRRGGEGWPSLNVIKRVFGGSFNAAREAVGLEPNRPGPAGRRPAGVHSPVRTIREHTKLVGTVVESRKGPRPWLQSPARTVVQRVEVPAPGDARLRKRVVALEQRLAKAAEHLRTARKAKAKAITRRKTVERTSEARRVRLAAAEAELRELRGDLSVLAREAARETQLAAAERFAVEREALEATIEALRTRVGELEHELELTDPAAAAAARREVAAAAGRVSRAQAAQEDAESRMHAALATARAAEAGRERAERAAARADGERVRVQSAVAGHARPLTAAEVAELRERGPQGPAVFTAAVKEVARAHGAGSKMRLQEALRRAAAAAVGWSGRL